MTDNQPHENPKASEISSNWGRFMTWSAWISALLVMTWFFQDKLEQQWNPNKQPLSATEKSGRNTVVLQQNRYGHYVTAGLINGQAVTFMLDTGATQVSVPQALANKLGMRPRGQSYVNTANGSVIVYPSTIDELQIGSIVLTDVPANINPHVDGEEILLGMSALKRVEFTQTGNQLIIRD